MNIYLYYLIILGITYSKSVQVEASSLYQYLNGSLKESCRFNVRIFVENLEGIILCGLDSQRNQFGVIIKNNKFICINYNKLSACGSLDNICGCDFCQNRWINLRLELSIRVINITCNNEMLTTLSLEDFYHDSKEEERYYRLLPLPKKMVNLSENRLFIMIGNIKQYTSENIETINPVKEQIVGCLGNFSFNGQLITLNAIGKKIRSSCLNVCNHNHCNSGLCQRKSITDFFCDCSKTALNGDHCNRSLGEYRQRINNSYEKIKTDLIINFKITWKLRSQKKFCLVSFEGRNEEYTIMINKNVLMMNEELIMVINEEDVNFINIVINNQSLNLWSNNKELKRKILLNEYRKINVGFSTKSEKCELFEGMFDFHYDSRQLRQIKQNIPERIKPNGVSRMNIMKIFIPIITIMFITLLICGLIILLRLSRRNVDTPNNDTIEDVVELREANVERSVRSISGHYSSVDYMKMNSATRSDNEDTDGYIVPRPEVIVEICPPLPPRNELLLSLDSNV